MKTSSFKLALVACLIFLSRVPFLSVGYGVDADAFRVVGVAREMADGGPYRPSRYPGSPLLERATSLVAYQDPFVVNGLSALMSVVAFLFLALIAEQQKVSHPLLLASAFALTPVVYISSVTTIDYVWSLAFGLVAFFLALRGHLTAAGFLLGLAAACRITALALLVPIAWRQLTEPSEQPHWKRSLMALGVCLLTTAAWYFPIVMSYEGTGDGQLPVTGSLIRVFKRASVDVWGILGTLALLCLVPHGWKRIAVEKILQSPERRARLICPLLPVAIYAALFALAPLEAGYLVPAVPFVLLVLAEVVTPQAFRLVSIAILISPFVLSYSKGDLAPYGPIIADKIKREENQLEAHAVASSVIQSPSDFVVVAGHRYPEIHLLVRKEERQRRLIEAFESVEDLKAEMLTGKPIFYLEPAVDAQLSENGVDLAAAGARPWSSRAP